MIQINTPYKLTKAEAKFAELLWRHAPLPSPKLVTLAAQELGWKKSTTYTMLKRLCDKGVFCNEAAVVSTVLSREEFYAAQSRGYVENTFGGSLPRFLAAFMDGGKLSDKQLAEIRQLIEQQEER